MRKTKTRAAGHEIQAPKANTPARPRAKSTAVSPADLRQRAGQYGKAVLQRLIDLAMSDDERIALAASQELLNRGFGRVGIAAQELGKSDQPYIVKFVNFNELEPGDLEEGENA